MIPSTWHFEHALASIAKYETDIFSLCETSSEFVQACCLFKIHLYQSGLFKLIKTMLKSFSLLGLSSVWDRYPKTWATKRSIIAYDEIKDRICKE